MLHLSPPLTLGIIQTSLKENEKRVPIHPDHLELIPKEVRKHLVFERGYGEQFDLDDEAIAVLNCGLAERWQLFETSDVVVVLKPMPGDFEAMKKGGILWGYGHCEEEHSVVQYAIDRKLTLIAIESMDIWGPRGERLMHAFEKNNELAGYAGVLDALRTRGMDGNYGPPRKSMVIGFGAVGRGAIHALQALGFQSVNVFTFRNPKVVANQIPGVIYNNVMIDDAGHMIVVYPDGSTRRMIDEIVTADIIVNAIRQDLNHPKMIIAADELDRELKRGSLIIDVSSSNIGIGFPFGRPTTFENPIFRVGNSFYYSVDHTPSYLWNSASWEISKCFIHYLPIVMAGPEEWNRNETICRAIEVREGVIQNEKVISCQNRATKYPHQVLS